MTKHQKKSGSTPRRKKIQFDTPLGRVHRYSNGDSKIELSAEGMSLMKEQFAAFEKKFGRPPGPKDPVFFDPDKDEPTEFSDAKLREMRRTVANVMLKQGLRPQVVHAFERTGLTIVAGQEDRFKAEELEEWHAAIEHYYEAKEMADEAREAGSHPAIVYAISKTGLYQPEVLELAPDGSYVRVASEEDEIWMEYLTDFAKLHPDLCKGPDPNTPSPQAPH